MRKITPVLLMLACATGCSTSSQPGPQPTARNPRTTHSAIRRNASYPDLASLRVAVQQVGIACGDDVWKLDNNPVDDTFTADGWCGSDIRIAVVEATDVRLKVASARMLSDARGSRGATSATPQVVQGPDWLVQVPTNEQAARVLAKLGGQHDVVPSTGASASSGDS